jgi:hypothetical protein
MEFGRPIVASKLSEQLHEIEAVLGVRWIRLARASWTRPGLRVLPTRLARLLPVAPGAMVRHEPMPRVAIRGATPRGSYGTKPAELAVLDMTSRDITIRLAAKSEVST